MHVSTCFLHPTFCSPANFHGVDVFAYHCSDFILQFCEVGRLSAEVGWKYQDVIATLEAKRKAKATVFHKDKKRDRVCNAFVTEVVSLNILLFAETLGASKKERQCKSR